MAFPNDTDPKFKGYAHPERIVSTAWLAENAGKPGLVVLESDEDVLLYATGHIPGARKIDWTLDLNDQVTRDYIDGEGFAKLCSRLGIARDTTVVVYGDNSNWWAAYALWVFSLFGHPDVRLLDGGRQKWVEEGRPMTEEVRDKIALFTDVPSEAVIPAATAETIYEVPRHEVTAAHDQLIARALHRDVLPVESRCRDVDAVVTIIGLLDMRCGDVIELLQHGILALPEGDAIGITPPLTVPLDRASVMAGRGMPTGVAPNDDKSLVTCRVGPRIFRPLRSAGAAMSRLELVSSRKPFSPQASGITPNIRLQTMLSAPRPLRSTSPDTKMPSAQEVKIRLQKNAASGRPKPNRLKSKNSIASSSSGSHCGAGKATTERRGP